jgi:Family of unknown function (DUF6345)
MRSGRRLRHIFAPTIGLILALAVPETVLSYSPQEAKQDSGTAAMLGCPRKDIDQQDINQQHPSAVPVSFDKAEVPVAPNDQMLLFKLQNDPGPMFWIESLIKLQHNEIASPLDVQLYGSSHAEPVRILEGKSVKGRLNLQTGEAVLYPSLSKLDLPTTVGNINSFSGRAGELLTSSDFLSQDETKISVDPESRILMGAKIQKGDGTPEEKPTAAYLGYFLAWRQVGEYPVYGIGSRASIVLNGKGDVVGLSRVWKRAMRTEEPIHAAHSKKEVRDAIETQLQKYRGNSIDVNHIELAYYDGNNQYLQPVYRFIATIHHRGTGNRGILIRDDSVIGYLPYGKEAVEPLTNFSNERKASPQYALEEVLPPQKENEDDLFVGRYVTRAWQPSDWEEDAQGFISQLSPPPKSRFKDSQYYWAEPQLFTEDKEKFINAMDVALVEGDGDWWMFGTTTTDCNTVYGSSPQSWCDLQKCCKDPQNCCSTTECCNSQKPADACCYNLLDPVNLNGDITSPGYGAQAGGRLTTLIIHSCEVIPTPEDTTYWAAPWWTVFGGLKSVVGYRTPMTNPDLAGGDYGQRLASGDPVVDAWLQDVISLSAYSKRPCDLVSHGGKKHRRGLPSAISTCGHEDDSLFSTSADGPDTPADGSNSCLAVWWFSDKDEAGRPLCEQK